MPRAKLYEVLDGLSRKGLLATIPGTPQRFRANPLTALYDTRSEELRSEEHELKRSIADLMLELMPGTRDAGPEGERDFLHLTKGRAVFVTTLRQFVASAQRSLVIVGDRLVLPRLQLYDDVYAKLARFGETGELLILVPRDAPPTIDGRPVHVDELSDAVRTFDAAGGDVLLVVRDEEETMEVHFLPGDLHPSRGSDRVIVNRAPEFAAPLARLARAAASSALPVPSGLTGRRRA